MLSADHCCVGSAGRCISQRTNNRQSASGSAGAECGGRAGAGGRKCVARWRARSRCAFRGTDDEGQASESRSTVQLEVAQDVLLNGRVVIPARSPVEGVLTEVRNKGMWGKSGAIHLHINSVNINGTNIRLKGDMDTRGETGTAGVVGAIVILPVAGFFITGTSAEMPLNMPGRAFLDQDIALAPAAPTTANTTSVAATPTGGR